MSDLITDYWTKEPTREYPPEMDARTEEQWLKTYDTQRRCRLGDVINDYLSDDTVDARKCYEEILAEVDEYASYHRNQLEKATALKSLLLGHRDPFGETGTITFGG